MPRRPADLARLEPRRVCLIKPSSLGDVVHALPVLAALRERWPDAHLAWVVNRGLRGLLDHGAGLHGQEAPGVEHGGANRSRRAAPRPQLTNRHVQHPFCPGKNCIVNST